MPKRRQFTIEDLEADLTSGSVKPSYFLHGAEDYLIDQASRLILAHALPEGTREFNLDVVYGTKTDASGVVALATSFPMMSTRRVVVVKEFEKLARTDAEKNLLVDYLTRPADTTVLVLIARQPDFRRQPFKAAREHSVEIECKPLYENQAPDWIMRRLRDAGRSIHPEVAHLLTQYVGTSMGILDSEIQKLLTYVGERKEISTDDVLATVGVSRDYTIFDLQNAVGGRKLDEALQISRKMLASSQSPQFLFSMLTLFFLKLWRLSDRDLLRLSDQQLGAVLKVHPYFVSQMREFRALFSTDEIERGLHVLLEADKALKTSSQDAVELLDMTLYALIRSSSDALRAVN